MNDAISVAEFIAMYSNRKGYQMNNLKLQKVLYFVQAEFLVRTNGMKPCFKDKIEAWDFGPVVPVVYHLYSFWGNMQIPYFGYEGVDDIPMEEKKVIRDVVDFCDKYSGTELLKIVQNQSPWKCAYGRGKHTEVTNDSIYEYFKEEK